MKIKFNFDQIKAIEFGAGIKDKDGFVLRRLHLDKGVKTFLQEMALTTIGEMNAFADQEVEGNKPRRYEPSETYHGQQYTFIPIDDELANPIKRIHEANGLTVDMKALSNPNVYFYFVWFIDVNNGRLTAIRRTAQAKAVLKGRYIKLSTDALKVVEDKVFKLDSDFDMLVDSENVHILRTASFESICDLKTAILAAVPKNMEIVKADLSKVELSNIQEYAMEHTRAARCLASIVSQKNCKNIKMDALIAACKKQKIAYSLNGDILSIKDNYGDFLNILDRRLYTSDIMDGEEERYKANSRQKIT